jgi:hypothetical protein
MLALCCHAAFAVAMLLLDSQLEAPELARLIAVPPILFAIIYGVFRVYGFHPIFNPAYRDWLATTPWTPAKPLPLGPVHLVGADVLLLAVAMGVTWPFTGAMPALQFVIVFLATYCLALMSALFSSEEWFGGYALWFGLGLMVLAWSLNVPFFVTAPVIYGVGMIGLRRSLRRLPLDFPTRNAAPAMSASGLSVQLGAPSLAGVFSLGWPFAYFSPQGEGLLLSRKHGTLISLLVGWIVFVVCSLGPVEDPKGAYVALLVICIIPSGLIRLLSSGVFEHGPPLRTGRLIISQYDCVFVAPILACLVGLVGGQFMILLNVPPAVGISVVMAAALFVLLTFGPERRRWLLTAPMHTTPPAGVGQRNSKLV